MSETEQAEMSEELESDQGDRASKKQKKSKSKRRRWFVRISVLMLVVAIYSAWQMWDIHRFGHNDDGSSADCAIVLGAAAWHNKPSPVFIERLDHAILLYEEKRVQVIILTGGFGKGADFAESEVAKKYCLKKGVPEKDIFIETSSGTTEENLIEAKRMMQEHRLKNALIVSDPWHLKRACSMAKHYEIAAKPSATKTSLYTSEESRMRFIWREFIDIHLWRFN